MAALTAIQAAINQYTPNYYNDPTASTEVNAINQTASSTLQSTLAALKSKISDSMNTYNTNLAGEDAKYQPQLDTLNNQATDTTNQYGQALDQIQQAIQGVPAKYQPDYNQHAVDAALNLRNVIEGAANRGDNGGMGQMQQLAVGTAQQNADSATDTSKNNDIQDYNNQSITTQNAKTAALNSIASNISSVGAQKAQDISTIKAAIDNLDTTGVDELNAAIATNNTDRIKNVLGQQQSEATAQATAEQKAAELQNAQIVAMITGNSRENVANINANKPTTTATAAVAKLPTPSQIASTALSANGSKTSIYDANSGKTTTTIDPIATYENTTNLLNSYGIDPNSATGQQVYASTGITKNVYDSAISSQQQATLTAKQNGNYNSIDNVANSYWHNTSGTKSNSSAETISRIDGYLTTQYNNGAINLSQLKQLATKYHVPLN
jgi:hypothetical protein